MHRWQVQQQKLIEWLFIFCLIENKLNSIVFKVCYLKMPLRPDRGTFLDSFGRVLIQESKLTLNYFVIAFMRRDVFGLRGTWLAHITINLRRKSHNKLQGGAIAIRTPPAAPRPPYLSCPDFLLTTRPPAVVTPSWLVTCLAHGAGLQFVVIALYRLQNALQHCHMINNFEWAVHHGELPGRRRCWCRCWIEACRGTTSDKWNNEQHTKQTQIKLHCHKSSASFQFD